VLGLGVSFSVPILAVGIENPGHLVEVSFLLYMIQPAHTLVSCPFGGLDFSDRVYAFACNPSTFVLGGTIYILASAKPLTCFPQVRLLAMQQDSADTIRLWLERSGDSVLRNICELPNQNHLRCTYFS